MMISTHSRKQPLFGRLMMTLMVASPLVPLGLGCSGQDGGIEVSEGTATSAANGLANLNGFRHNNGLTALKEITLTGGLSLPGALSSSSTMMNTADGRMAVTYLVKCALPTGHTLVKTDTAGTRYSFSGDIGLAPEWEKSACGQTCQEWVTSCLLSLVNTTGVHVPVWMVAQNSAVGWGQNSAYPHQEGSFFGNIFATTPRMYYCGGRDYLVSPIAGRIGSPQVDTEYSNIYGARGLCSQHCTASDYPNMTDGYKACSGWNNVVTIWRK